MTKLLFAVFLPNAPDHLLGDLEEEAAANGPLWFLRHTLTAAYHQAQLLETAAATAFLLALPLTLALELRRYSLTLIYFRESANFTPTSLTILALLTALLAALQLRALPNPRLALIAATITTAGIAHITNAPQFLTAATLLGGSLATLQRKRTNP
jgi:hypothetical protein